MAELLYRLGRACARRARTVITVWLALLVTAGVAFTLFSGGLEDSFSIPDTPTKKVNEEVSEKFSDMGGGTGTVVYQTEDGSALSTEQQEAIGDRAEEAAELSGVDNTVNPFATQDERAEQQEKLDKGRTEIEDGREKLNESQDELDQAREQAESAGRLDQVEGELDAQQSQIDEKREELKEQSQQLERGATLQEMASDIRSVSEDGSTALLNISFAEEREEISQETKDAVMAVFEDDPVSGTTVDFDTNIAMSIPSLVSTAEVIGVIVAAVVLVVMLGTLVGAGLPIVTALVGVGIATMTAMSLSGVVQMASVTPILGLMLGLAVGIDYALFLVNRHRRQLKQGTDVRESIGLATGTAGNAVVFAGMTVLIALLGLNLTGIGFLGLMGTVGSLAIAIAVLIAVTLIPALLSLVRMRILSRHERDRLANSAEAERTGSEHTNTASAARPMRTGWALLRVTVAVAALGIIALPVLDLRLGMPNGSSEPADSTQYQAYTAVSENFGEGQNGTLLVAADLPSSQGDGQVEDYQVEIAEKLHDHDDVTGVAPAGISDDESLAVFQVMPEEGPSSESTEDLVHTLRDMEPIEGAGELGVAGAASGNIDISEKLSDALPTYLAVVVGMSLIILLLVFRSIFVPVVATLGFILSYFAALGSVVAIYQWGWLGGLFGVQDPGPVLSFLPTILVGILFGLAMDYMLFIGSGMREAYVHGRPARAAVMEGFRAGRAVVTAAAIIMVSVFGGFIFSETMMISSIGLALAAGVLLDAFVVRMTLIPALMHLAGEKAWWLPRWLDRLLPDIDVEGTHLERHHTREQGQTPPQQPVASSS